MGCVALQTTHSLAVREKPTRDKNRIIFLLSSSCELSVLNDYYSGAQIFRGLSFLALFLSYLVFSGIRYMV